MNKIIHVHPDAESEVVEAIKDADAQLHWTDTAEKDYTVLPSNDQ